MYLLTHAVVYFQIHARKAEVVPNSQCSKTPKLRIRPSRHRTSTPSPTPPHLKHLEMPRRGRSLEYVDRSMEVLVSVHSLN